MSNTKKGRAQDWARVACGQDHEVRYEAEKKGVMNDAGKGAVEDVGTAVQKSRTALLIWVF